MYVKLNGCRVRITLRSLFVHTQSDVLDEHSYKDKSIRTSSHPLSLRKISKVKMKFLFLGTLGLTECISKTHRQFGFFSRLFFFFLTLQCKFYFTDSLVQLAGTSLVFCCGGGRGGGGFFKLFGLHSLYDYTIKCSFC